MAPPTLILALDQPDRAAALNLVEKVDGAVDFFKVGSELFTAAGPDLVRELARDARVFLDLKFHDVPATVGRAVAAASRLGVTIVDVHCGGGEPMLRAAVTAAQGVEVFGVTVLTHLEDKDLAAVGFERGSREQALWLARLARQSGLSGVVASAHEVEAIREATEGTLQVLVPGIRPAWASERDDQRRIATPLEAARAGARYVVVGRAIARAEDPRAAAERILEELDAA